MFGRVPEPPNQLFVFFETPGYLNKIKNNPWDISKHIIFGKPQNAGNPEISQLSKRRAPTNDEDPLNKIWNILEMGSISPRKHKMEIW